MGYATDSTQRVRNGPNDSGHVGAVPVIVRGVRSIIYKIPSEMMGVIGVMPKVPGKGLMSRVDSSINHGYDNFAFSLFNCPCIGRMNMRSGLIVDQPPIF